MDEGAQNRRQSDPLLIELKAMFKDHQDRYERDYQHTQTWRKGLFDRQEELKAGATSMVRDVLELKNSNIEIIRRLKVHCDFISDVSPIYKTLCKILIIAGGSIIGLAVAAFWKHLAWH